MQHSAKWHLNWGYGLLEQTFEVRAICRVKHELIVAPMNKR